MTKEESKSPYEEFRDNSKIYSAVESGLEGIRSEDDEERVAGRQDLEGALRKVYGDKKKKMINIGTPEHQLRDHGVRTRKVYGDRLEDQLKKNPNQIISGIRENYEEDLSKLFLGIGPVSIKDEKDPRVIAHTNYIALQEGLRMVHEKGETNQIAEMLIESNYNSLIERGYSKEETDILMGSYAEVIKTTRPELLVEQGKRELKVAKERIEKLIPKDERAAYTEANLKEIAREHPDKIAPLLGRIAAKKKKKKEE